MASTDTQEQAVSKNVATELTHTNDVLNIQPAAHTHMSFYTGGDGEIRVQAELRIERDGTGDGKVRLDPSVKIQDFPVNDALPSDLQEAAQRIHLYLHNYAVEQAQS